MLIQVGGDQIKISETDLEEQSYPLTTDDKSLLALIATAMQGKAQRMAEQLDLGSTLASGDEVFLGILAQAQVGHSVDFSRAADYLLEKLRSRKLMTIRL